MRQLLLTFLFFFAALQGQAAKAHPTPVKVVQSDGTTLTVVARGDESFHYYLTIDGVLLWHEGNDFFIAKVNSDGSLSPTKQLAHEKGMRPEKELQLIESQDRQLFYEYQERMAPQRVMRKEPIPVDHTFFPHIGKPRVPVILAQFADDKFIDEDPMSVFKQYLNAEEIDNTVGNGTVGFNHGSVRRYFKDMSFGAFEPQFDLYGPVTLADSTATYGEGRGDNMGLFIPEACHLAAEQGLKFSDYDSNDDGYVDLVFVIYAGYAECFTGNPTTCIWPKQGIVSAFQIDGKYIYRFCVNSELNFHPKKWKEEPFQRINGIGLFCHEFSHCMGMPDFYPTSSAAQNAFNPGMEQWSLMDEGEYMNNGYNPTEYTAWEREAMGWFTIDTLETTGTYELRNINEPGGKAYRIINKADSAESFILQNIQMTGWNSKLYGHGMLVTHVDFSPSLFRNNQVNNTIGHSRMTFIPADDEYISAFQIDNKTITREIYSENHSGDPYPGAMKVRTVKELPAYTGKMKERVFSIEEEDGIVTFYFEKETTGIDEHLITRKEENRIWTLDGRYAGTNTSSLPKGIYLVNGKKTVIR
jgi:immune inhibitor A